MISADAHEIALAFAQAWAPIDPEPAPAWCEDHVRLSDDYEGSGGRYDCSSRPWWREILGCYLDRRVTFVAMKAATQVGKTLTLIAGILWCAEHSPAPGLVVLPDQISALELRDRVYATAEASLRTGLVRVRVPSEHKWNSRWIDLGSMRVYLAWSGSRQRLRGRACQRVWCSEVDVYRGDLTSGDPVAAAHQRTKAFYHYVHFHESSPTESPSTITSLEESCTDRRRWHVPCPECGRWQELRFFCCRSGELAGRGGIAGYTNEHGQFLSAEKARRQAHYVCLNGCRIRNEQKQAMLEGGRWISQTQKISKDGQVSGRRPPRRKMGYHLWSVHSDAISWGDVAAAYLEAREQGTVPEFWGNWLGLAYEQQDRIPTWRQLGRRAGWTHEKGTVPSACWFLTLGADVQEDEVFYVVRGWAPECTSWLVDWGSLEREETDGTEIVKSDLAQLGPVLSRRYGVVAMDGPARNPLGHRSLRVRLGNVDSNHRPMDVHNWMRSLGDAMIKGPGARVRAVRGDHRVDPAQRYRMHVVETNTRTGEKYEGGLEQWGIYVYHFYQDLAARLAGQANLPGSWHVTKDALRRGKDYLQQVTNFHRVVEVDRRGKKKSTWRPRSNRIDVDYWDCEIYAMVAAHMVAGDLGWSEQAWRRQWAPKGPKRQRTVAAADEYGGIADR